MVDGGAMPNADTWPSINVIITTNPRFVTEKGVKIGDRFETAAKAYGFNNEDIIKESDSDWSVWLPNDCIILEGSKEGIASIGLGYRPACGG